MITNIAGHPPTQRTPDRQFEGIGRALFLIVIGGIGLVQTVPHGTWLIGTGLIMLGLNLARYLNGIQMSSFTIGLGILTILLGIGAVTGLDLPLFPILLILTGAHIPFQVATLKDHSEASVRVGRSAIAEYRKAKTRQRIAVGDDVKPLFRGDRRIARTDLLMVGEPTVMRSV